MGHSKRLLEREMLFHSNGDKHLCSDCVDDYALKEYIESNGNEGFCDYCENEDTNVVSFDDFMEFFLEGIDSEWDQPGNWMGYDGREGGWQGADVYDGWDLIDALDPFSENDDLITDIRSALVDREFCEIDPYSLRRNQEDYYNWQQFSDQVKYKTRFVFYRVENPQHDPYELSQPYEILDRICDLVSDLTLFSVIPKGEVIKRFRRHNENEYFDSYKDIGPPSKGNAKFSNRMSPAGIPMFYGFFDHNVPLKYWYKHMTKNKGTFENAVTIGFFESVKDLKVMDLTSLPPVPSIFDQDNRSKRMGIIFLRSFLGDFSKEVKKDGSEHIDYVPTQIFTEYFRHIYRTPDGDPLYGIIYPSSMMDGVVECVLFLDSDNCMQDNIPPDNNEIYEILPKEKILSLLSDKTERHVF